MIQKFVCPFNIKVHNYARYEGLVEDFQLKLEDFDDNFTEHKFLSRVYQPMLKE